MTSPRLRALTALVLAPALGLSLAGCGGGSATKDGSGSESPTAALTAAKKTMDAASSWHMTLSTTSTPSGGGDAILKADGVGTHSPAAWKGSVDAVFKGLRATIPIVSVGGKVYAKLPFSTKYANFNPAQYDAPDPASFMSATTGLSALLTEMKSPKSTGSARAGSQIVTTYSGTLAGTDVKRVIPSASASGSYPTTININKAHQVTSVHVTGAFFQGNDSVTYELTVDDYGQDVKITAP